MKHLRYAYAIAVFLLQSGSNNFHVGLPVYVVSVKWDRPFLTMVSLILQ